MSKLFKLNYIVITVILYCLIIVVLSLPNFKFDNQKVNIDKYTDKFLSDLLPGYGLTNFTVYKLETSKPVNNTKLNEYANNIQKRLSEGVVDIEEYQVKVVNKQIQVKVPVTESYVNMPLLLTKQGNIKFVVSNKREADIDTSKKGYENYFDKAENYDYIGLSNKDISAVYLQQDDQYKSYGIDIAKLEFSINSKAKDKLKKLNKDSYFGKVLALNIDGEITRLSNLNESFFSDFKGKFTYPAWSSADSLSLQVALMRNKSLDQSLVIKDMKVKNKYLSLKDGIYYGLGLVLALSLIIIALVYFAKLKIIYAFAYVMGLIHFSALFIVFYKFLQLPFSILSLVFLALGLIIIFSEAVLFIYLTKESKKIYSIYLINNFDSTYFLYWLVLLIFGSVLFVLGNPYHFIGILIFITGANFGITRMVIKFLNK